MLYYDLFSHVLHSKDLWVDINYLTLLLCSKNHNGIILGHVVASETHYDITMTIWLLCAYIMMP